MRYKLNIAYEGSSFGGWQVQTNAESVQGHIQKALSTLIQKPITIHGSGRTDAGVHALGQVAHFDIDELDYSLDTMRYKLNGLLSEEIRILSVEEVDPEFHARYSAKGKTYHYHIHLDPVLNPFEKNYCHHQKGKCDVYLLKHAVKFFEGEHDFTSFTCEADPTKSAIRTIYSINFIQRDDGITLEFHGSGFLYKMIRNIVGTLLDIARGKIPLEDLESIFEKKDRRFAGTAAPAKGLFLMEVHY